MTHSPSTQSWHLGRMVTAWLVSAILGVVVTLLWHGEQRFQWLVLAVGVSVLVTFALQLSTAERDGFITRISFSVAGSVVVIAAIDILGLLLVK